MVKKSKYADWTKDELVDEIVRIREITYGLVWHRDKAQEDIDVIINSDVRTPEESFKNEVSGKPFPVLTEVREKLIANNADMPSNILIEGDNYHSLAVLNFTHKESVDFIYIDPPYNTGNKDFVYNDSIVDREDTFKHSKWLSFMEKRLYLAKNLLKDSGIIAISIDDNEQAPLRMLCDEIFGTNNFIANLPTIMNFKGNPDNVGFSDTHEYTLVYTKNSNKAKFNQFDVDEESIEKEWSEDEYGLFKKADTLRRTGQDASRLRRPKGWFPVFVNFDKQICYTTDNDVALSKDDFELWPINNDGDELSWTWSKDKINRDSYNLIVTGSASKPNVYKKQRPQLGELPTKKPKSVFYKAEYSTSSATMYLKSVLGSKKFDGPKPVQFIKDLIQIMSPKNGIVLDFMAGSGTTGEAVMQLNKQDHGTRTFILCTNNENNIATDVCYPRLEKIINGYTNIKGIPIEGLSGNLRYYTAYDFVESAPTDRNKRKLVKKSTEMLCLKEGIFDPVAGNDEFKIFKNGNKYLAIIFYEDAISNFIEQAKLLDGDIITYVFTLGGDPQNTEFESIIDKVTLRPIPEVILKIYKEIFK